MPTPAFTNVPINGNAINAGTNVIVPSRAAETVASKTDCLPTKFAISDGGNNVRISPIANIMENMLVAIPFPMPKAILSACFVLALSFANEFRFSETILEVKAYPF